MAPKKNIDDLFREKLGQRQFPVEEESWKAVLGLLEKRAPWYAGKFLWLGLSAVAVLGLLAVFMLPEQGEQESTRLENHSVLAEERENDISPARTDLSPAKAKATPAKTGTKPAKSAFTPAKTSLPPAKTEAYPAKTDLPPAKKDARPAKTDIRPAQPDVSPVEKDALFAENEAFPQEKEPVLEERDAFSEEKNAILAEENNLLALEKLLQMPFRSLAGLSNKGKYAPVAASRPEKDRLNWLRRLDAGAIAGANLSKGFLNNGARAAGPSIGPVAGLRLGCQMGSTASIGMNLLYHVRGGVNGRITTTNLAEAQAQGSDAYTATTVTTLQLHYLDLPVYLNYRMERHYFLIGLQYSHLLAAFSRTEEKQLTVAGNTTLSDTKKKSFGDAGSFAPYDVAAVLGYEYALNEKFDLGLRINYGLYDVTDDESFGTGSVIDKNLQLRLLLTRKLIMY